MTLTVDAVELVPEPAPEDVAGTRDAMERAGRRIAPLWPLTDFVAVNPYVGLADDPFEVGAERLAAAAGVRTTLPMAAYLAMVDEGRISSHDLGRALRRHPAAPQDLGTFLDEARRDRDEAAAWAAIVPTVAAVASSVTGRDWRRFVVDRVSSWAAAYFDEGQALWRSAPDDLGIYAAWREEAAIDRTADVAGLAGFRRAVASLPADPVEAAHHGLGHLGLPADAHEAYLHALLLQVAGWAGHVRRLGFERERQGLADDRIVELAAVLVSWEVALLETLGSPEVDVAWRRAVRGWSSAPRLAVRAEVLRRTVLQDAFDLAEQRRLLDRLGRSPHGSEPAGRPGAQAVFCIDVRSEVLRRHLEAVAPDLDTVGFAGFFGMPVSVTRLGHDDAEAQCPVLLEPACAVPEIAGGPAATANAAAARRRSHQVQRAWKSFKLGAVSCFSFVGPVGLAYLPKLFTDGFARTRPVPTPEDEGLPPWAIAAKRPDASAIPLDQRVALAAGALRGMSLVDALAPLVLLVGHGASTTNNPYGSGLDCGACGGHSGAPNARVAAAVLNDPAVRAALGDEGMVVPEDTWFVEALHDTTLDEVTVLDADLVPSSHVERLRALEGRLALAGAATRAERSRRLGVEADADIDREVRRRARDWAQVRPEWGLAGCHSFVVAPRSRTRGLDLGGQAFLHSYDWTQDDGFAVLELVMTAPMVVASWISLQYYGSSVDPDRLGAGNKVLHNVVGRMGVIEGNAGDLRVGLPLQSVHDGTALQHPPRRLAVVIAAPIEAINDVVARHEDVRHLLDHRWVHLLAMDDDGVVRHRYAGDLEWEAA